MATKREIGVIFKAITKIVHERESKIMIAKLSKCIALKKTTQERKNKNQKYFKFPKKRIKSNKVLTLVEQSGRKRFILLCCSFQGVLLKIRKKIMRTYQPMKS